jgi:hypothetical protein
MCWKQVKAMEMRLVSSAKEDVRYLESDNETVGRATRSKERVNKSMMQSY